MTTQTQAKPAKPITYEQVTKYTEALKQIAHECASTTGTKLAINKYVTNHSISHYTTLALKELGALIDAGKDKVTWNQDQEIDVDFINKLIGVIRVRQNATPSKKAKTSIPEAKDLNKVIANKLAEKSKSKAVTKGLVAPAVNEPIVDDNTRVVHFDSPREVQINGVVTMRDVTSLVFSLDGTRILITASIGESSVFVKIPNKPLHLSDRYQPGKQVSYIITTV
jgi:hypothetical protein